MGSQSRWVEDSEARRLLSASIQIQNGTLIVRGTPRSDHIVVSEHEANGSSPIDGPALFVRINGRERKLDAPKILRVRVEAGEGNDHVEMSDDPFATGSHLAQVFIEQTRPATILGGGGNDTLIGGEAADSISGGAGRDLLGGAIGNDTIDGDGNSDTISGNAGIDLLRGGNGDDRFAYDDQDFTFGGRGTDFYKQGYEQPINTLVKSRVSGMEGIMSYLTQALPAVRVDGNTLFVVGTKVADRFAVANSADGFLSVSAGDDWVGHIPEAGIKHIHIDGGEGDDHIEIDESVRRGDDNPYVRPVEQDVVLIGGNGNDTLIAGITRDSLYGGAGDDVLAGGAGDDTLDGGQGQDTLWGEAGNDSLLHGESNEPDALLPLEPFVIYN